jgi:type III pantothenate kinase
MKLLLDMGNSRLKSAVLDDAGDLSSFVAMTYLDQDPITILQDHLDQYQKISKVVLVSVLGKDFHELALALFRERKIVLIWAASSRKAHGVVNNYQQPTQLGSDRFVALVAARKAFPKQNCIVIDCGTAVTIDALSFEGEFCGGVIIPGLKLWSDSLIKRAGQLNEHQIDDTDLFAKDTAQAIGSGSIFGLVCAIEGISKRMSQKLEDQTQSFGKASRLVICGGDAELVSIYSQLEFELMPNLVLIGLAEYT